MKIEIKDLFIEIIADENEYITIWDKVNIEEYSGSKIMYCPKAFDTTIVYAISEEEHDELLKQQTIIMEENKQKYDNNSNE